jgi:PAS domain S-box-containing protein
MGHDQTSNRSASLPASACLSAQVPPEVGRILETVRDIFIVLDADWRFVYLNAAAVKTARQPLEKLLGRTVWECFPALRGTEVEVRYRQAMAQQVPVHFEAPGVLTGRWYDISVYPAATGLTIYGRDVSERKQAEEALRASERLLRESGERHRLLAELSSDYSYTCQVDPDGTIRIESATEGFERVTGYSVAEVEAQGGWKTLVHPDDRDNVRREQRVLAGQRDVDEVRIITRQGDTRWIRFSTVPAADPGLGRVVRLLGAVQDITERKRAEIALRESEERFRNFMDNNPAVAFMRDPEGRYVYFNRTHQLLFQGPSTSWLGKTLFDVFPAQTAAELAAHDAEVMATGLVLRAEEKVPALDGIFRDWLAFKFPIQDALGRRFLGGVAVDITDRKVAEQALRESEERLQALSRRLLEVQEAERRSFARELHDEIGQALTGLSLVLKTSALAHGEDLSARLREAQALVKELMAKARDLSLRWRPTMLDDLGLLPALLWLIDRYTAQTSISVHFEHRGLEQRFRQQVETAAYRIVQEGLTNVARHAGVATAALRVWLGTDVLCIQIEDQGTGFEVRLLQSSARSGGLSGMKERVHLLRGRLVLESAPGHGTRLTAQLPVQEAENGEGHVTDHFAGR